MPLLLSDYANALKEVLLPYIRNNFPKETILLDQMKRNANVQQFNDEFIAPVHPSRHGGIVNLANDGNNVNPGGGRDLGRATVSVETVTAAMNISRLAIDASRGNNLAVEGALENNVKTLASD